MLVGVGGTGVLVGGTFVFVATDSGVNVAVGGTLVLVAVGGTSVLVGGMLVLVAVGKAGVFVGTAPLVQTVMLQLLRDPPSAAV